MADFDPTSLPGVTTFDPSSLPGVTVDQTPVVAHPNGIAPPDSAMTQAQLDAQDNSSYASLEPKEPGLAHLLWHLGNAAMRVGAVARGQAPLPAPGVDSLSMAAPFADGPLRFGDAAPAPVDVAPAAPTPGLQPNLMNRLLASRIPDTDTAAGESAARVSDLTDAVQKQVPSGGVAPTRLQAAGAVKTNLGADIISVGRDLKTAGLIDTSDLAMLNAAREAADSHSQVLSTAPGSPFDAIGDWNVPQEIKDYVQNKLRDLDTSSASQFANNTTGPLNVAGTVLGRVVPAGAAFATGHPMLGAEALVGSPYSATLGGKVGTALDNLIGSAKSKTDLAAMKARMAGATGTPLVRPAVPTPVAPDVPFQGAVGKPLTPPPIQRPAPPLTGTPLAPPPIQPPAAPLAGTPLAPPPIRPAAPPLTGTPLAPPPIQSATPLAGTPLAPPPVRPVTPLTGTPLAPPPVVPDQGVAPGVPLAPPPVRPVTPLTGTPLAAPPVQAAAPNEVPMVPPRAPPPIVNSPEYLAAMAERRAAQQGIPGISQPDPATGLPANVAPQGIAPALPARLRPDTPATVRQGITMDQEFGPNPGPASVAPSSGMSPGQTYAVRGGFARDAAHAGQLANDAARDGALTMQEAMEVNNPNGAPLTPGPTGGAARFRAYGLKRGSQDAGLPPNKIDSGSTQAAMNAKFYQDQAAEAARQFPAQAGVIRLVAATKSLTAKTELVNAAKAANPEIGDNLDFLLTQGKD